MTRKKGKVLVYVIILGAIAALLGSIIWRIKDQLMVPHSSRFYCALQADANRGGEVWTVMYNRNNQVKPWLRMVRNMGGDWDTQRRCEEIARRLDLYRQDGLISLEYRTHPNTPGQYVICAKTQISSDHCPLVLTLMPDDDPYEALREVAGALLPGTVPSYQCDRAQNCPPAKPLDIPLGNQL